LQLSTFDIYYGNDCYGRGTYAGGEFNVKEAVHEICKYPMSVAIFGQAFTYECWESYTDAETVQNNEDHFWLNIESPLVELATSAGLNECLESVDGEINVAEASKDSKKGLAKMKNDWNIQDHGKYGLWEID
jgi:hypothetical protein